jgi:outer membrane biosynthesis protein TonB
VKKIYSLDASAINHSFEAEKNRKAFLYTSIICGLFLILAIFYTWPLQVPPTPTVLDLIEVNLGNEQEGLGDVQPLVKGNRAPDNQSVASHQSAKKATAEPSKTIQAEESNDENAAPVVKSEKKKETAKVENKESSTKNSKNVNPSPVVNPNPAPKKPKIALYKGGTGNGGNGDADNNYRNHGYKPGNGDTGSPDGKADSYGNSPEGRSGVSVIRGLSGRRPISFPDMQGDFNENAKVYVDIKVDASGKVTSAMVAKGTTTSSATLRNIAVEKAKQLKFPAARTDIESGTILFNFVLKS